MFDFTVKGMERINIKNKDVAKTLDDLTTKVVKHYSSVVAREHLHRLLLGLVEFCNSVRDGGRIDNLFTRLPENANKRGALIWLRDFSGWRLGKDKAGAIKFLSKDKEGETQFFFIEEGATIPFYAMPEVKADGEKLPIDFEKLLMSLLARGIKAANDGKIADPVTVRLFKSLDRDLPLMREKFKAEVAEVEAVNEGAKVIVEKAAEIAKHGQAEAAAIVEKAVELANAGAVVPQEAVANGGNVVKHEAPRRRKAA